MSTTPDYHRQAGHRMPTQQPPPRQAAIPRPRNEWPTTPQESRGMTTLRATAYLLTSLASLLFVALVIYGYVQYQQAASALEDAFGGLGIPTAPAFDLPALPPPPPPPPG